MFGPKHRVIYGIILFALYTCGYPGKHSSKDSEPVVDLGTANSPSATKKNNGKPKDFLDSVLAKTDLPFDQIKQYTNIDTVNYKEHIDFSGDTIWFRSSKHPLAVVSYRDGHIDKKLLLVFNKTGKCTASLMVGMNGDVDSFDSVVRNYKVIDNSNFSTTETWTYRGDSKNDKVTVTTQFYWINKKGNIMAQNNIIHSFTRPKNSMARR
ncbi:MAG: hypothetical protein ACXVJB_04735 [Mucilaginibacter sp.]